MSRKNRLLPNWLGIYAVAFMLFLYAPVVLLPLFAFNSSTIIAFPLTDYTTEWFTVLWETEALHSAVRNSLFVGITTAVLSTLLGACAARAMARYRFPVKRGIVGLVMLPLVLPEIIVGVALLVVLVQLGVPLSLWTVIGGHVLICIPFAIAILNSAFASLDQSLEEASFDLGESRWGTFRRIILPLVMPGIISSLLICFTISLDEFIIAYFLSGADTVLSAYIYSQFRFPARVPAMLALGTVLVLVSIVLLSIAEYFRRRGIAKTGGKDTGGFL